MLEDATNNLKKSIETAIAYCAKNRMILVRVDVPPYIYCALKEHYCNLANEILIHPVRFDIEQLCGVPICINKDIKKPQYVMEMNNGDWEGLIK